MGASSGSEPGRPTWQAIGAMSNEGANRDGRGHLESVQVVYDPRKVGYETLLDVFWHNIDPLESDGQFCDHGPQYRTAIFYRDAAQRRVAEESKRRLVGRFNQPVVTTIVPARAFYPAKQYHQHYYRKNPISYQAYRLGCGRDRRLKELWRGGGARRPSQKGGN